ncbi:unnamed protein product, partial [Iphiclides podalirius]
MGGGYHLTPGEAPARLPHSHIEESSRRACGALTGGDVTNHVREARRPSGAPVPHLMRAALRFRPPAHKNATTATMAATETGERFRKKEYHEVIIRKNVTTSTGTDVQ